MEASGDGKTHAALAVQEWEVLAPTSQPVVLRREDGEPTCR